MKRRHLVHGWMAIGLLAVVVSAIGVVYAKHASRKLFVELQGVRGERDQLEIEWGRLQLEEGTLATHGLVEETAREELNMRIPSPENVVVIRP